MLELPFIDPNKLDFPDPRQALDEPNGLLALGGDLSVERLTLAYQQGIFPWFSPEDPILWWSPNPRAVLDPTQLHIGRTLRRFMSKTALTVTLNQAFEQVIRACSEDRHDGTWITNDIQTAYTLLHQQGLAHSVEIWQNQQLVGGLYGVEQGALFCGESMFSRQANASKLALVAFCLHFIRYGGKLVDCQILNRHTQSLGVIEITREAYLLQLRKLQKMRLPLACWQRQNLSLTE